MQHDRPFSLTRRQFLAATASTALAGWSLLPSVQAAIPALPQAGIGDVLDATAPGGIDLTIDYARVLVGGKPTSALAINGSVPGPTIRMQEGKRALIRVHNRLAEATSIHWHGILLPYTMDGVPGISFAGIPAGETFTYDYQVSQNGTYWYHSHSGLQEQLGHYGMLVIDPADADPVAYDVEHLVLLSDWTYEDPHAVLRKLKTREGYYNFQRPTLSNIDDQMAAEDSSMKEVLSKRLAWDAMRMDPTDISDVTGATYAFLMNGKTAAENPTFIAKPGQRVRFRIVNASSMTYYDIRIPGLPMTVVQADGQNVKPVETDELRIAVAENYDVIVTLPDDQPYTLFAETMDRSGYACGTLATHAGLAAAVPALRARPMLTMADMGMMHGMKGMNQDMAGMNHGKHDMEGMNQSKHDMAGMNHELPTENLPDQVPHGTDMHGPASITMAQSAYRQLDDPGPGLGKDDWRVLTYGQLRALKPPPDRRPPTRQLDLHLTGNMHKYVWGFDGKKWSEAEMIRFQYGERLRINFINDTMMNHPLHLHGMWMDLYAGHDYAENPRKHTITVQPAELVTVDITADAPGQWAFHCHLLYHMEAGMFRTVAVVKSLAGGATHEGV